MSSSSFRYTRPRSEKRRDSNTSLPSQFSEKRQAVAAVVQPPLVETRHTTTPQAAPPVPSTISYSLGHSLGAGPAIAAAASQAIAATQQVRVIIYNLRSAFTIYRLFYSDAAGSKNGKFESIIRSDQHRRTWSRVQYR